MHGNTQTDWGTPKHIQQLKSHDDTRWHNKNKLCPKTKGEHVFDQIDTEFLFNRPWIKRWRCKCGKKGKYEFINKPAWLK